ncbi:cysteine proteinase, partial [Cryphonectria parasitica EP155]
GPRLGPKTPIDAIAAEYTTADPVYVAKTMALPHTYSHYRPVKGDGNCGWRAIGFCYFELLIHTGSREVVQGEQLRLSQLNDFLVNSGGYDPVMFMDFVEETLQLFQNIADNIHNPAAAHTILADTFNDDGSMGVLYHLRLLAASWLKGNREQYDAWCETGIEGYCMSMLEPPDREIEELGIVLLVEVLLRPIGFVLQIAYLDRSAGTEVNTHRFPESGDDGGPFIHLLYRPGHYDILYKRDPVQVQVNRVAFDPTTFGRAPGMPAAWGFENPLVHIPCAAPLSPMAQLADTSWFPEPQPDPSSTPPGAQTASDACTHSTTCSQVSTESQPTPPSATTPTTPTSSIRFSRYQYEEPFDVTSWPEQTTQSLSFKNSHFNKAHYNNPNFTPEEYVPEVIDEAERLERATRKRIRKERRESQHSRDDGSNNRKEK